MSLSQSISSGSAKRPSIFLDKIVGGEAVLHHKDNSSSLEKFPWQHTLSKTCSPLVVRINREVTCNITKVLLKLPGDTSLRTTALRLYQYLKHHIHTPLLFFFFLQCNAMFLTWRPIICQTKNKMTILRREIYQFLAKVASRNKTKQDTLLKYINRVYLQETEIKLSGITC